VTRDLSKQQIHVAALTWMTLSVSCCTSSSMSPLSTSSGVRSSSHPAACGTKGRHPVTQQQEDSLALALLEPGHGCGLHNVPLCVVLFMGNHCVDGVN
jgi:hypothetical protein